MKIIALVKQDAIVIVNTLNTNIMPMTGGLLGICVSQSIFTTQPGINLIIVN